MVGAVKKKGKYVTIANTGLLSEEYWKPSLKGYPLSLTLEIRKQLRSNIKGIAEKYNRNSRYFGYRQKEGPDAVYIYIQKKGLRIDLRIDREFEDELKRAGFKVKYINNFQGRAGWLTGWKVPHDTKKLKFIMRMLYKAFET